MAPPPIPAQQNGICFSKWIHESMSKMGGLFCQGQISGMGVFFMTAGIEHYG